MNFVQVFSGELPISQSIANLFPREFQFRHLRYLWRRPRSQGANLLPMALRKRLGWCILWPWSQLKSTIFVGSLTWARSRGCKKGWEEFSQGLDNPTRDLILDSSTGIGLVQWGSLFKTSTPSCLESFLLPPHCCILKSSLSSVASGIVAPTFLVPTVLGFHVCSGSFIHCIMAGWTTISKHLRPSPPCPQSSLKSSRNDQKKRQLWTWNWGPMGTKR